MSEIDTDIDQGTGYHVRIMPAIFANTLCLAAVCSLLLPLQAVSAEPDWTDIESRIQYGYYTEDVRAVNAVKELLAPLPAESASKGYYAALANYRLNQLFEDKDKRRAREAANACVDNLDRALKLEESSADALALQSVCLDRLAGLEAWRTPFAASRSGAQIEKARHFGPKNPRVMLLDATEVYERPHATAADKEHALEGFRKAAAAFEAERRDSERVPGWGAAEAYLYLARCELERGEMLAARDALERALLIAPEFAAARRLMTRITTG